MTDPRDTSAAPRDPAERDDRENRDGARQAGMISRFAGPLGAVAQRRARSPASRAFAAGLLVLALTSCRARPGGESPRPSPSEQGVVRSNLLRADYVGSAACAECHREIYERFVRSPMHKMTREAATAEIAAPFENVEFRFKADSALLEQSGAERLLTLRKSGHDPVVYRVTKVIGGRYREDFVGVRAASRAEQGFALAEEVILPISYLLFEGSFRYKGYSVFSPERTDLREGPVWRQTCLFCHNTPPHFVTLYDELLGPGAPSYQGSASIDLPPDRAFAYEVTDRDAVVSELARELSRVEPRRRVAREMPDALADAARTTRELFGEPHLIELGIGCEACHGGSREHVERPGQVLPTFALKSDFLRVTTGAGDTPNRAEDINRACAKCHTVLFSRYPHTWEGRRRRDRPGGSSINSGEARDFLLGGCASRLSCAGCHDPHAEDSDPKALEGRRGTELCTGCHQEFRHPKQIRAHTHHRPESSGSVCINCHMPKKNMGLGYELTRYHRVGSPTDPERVEGDRPLECALCHADKSVAVLVATMERFWKKSYDRRKLERLYGKDLGINALSATLLAGKPHEKAVAIALAGERRDERVISLLVAELGNEYPLVRFWARHAIERILGEPLPVDMHAAGVEIVAAAQRHVETRRRERRP